jgi:hypothetical protein
MTSDRKKPGFAFWATVVVVAMLVAYPLSQGPWITIYVATHADQPEIDASSAFYAPIELAIENSPRAIQDAYDGYLEWWAGLGIFCHNETIRTQSLIVP